MDLYSPTFSKYSFVTKSFSYYKRKFCYINYIIFLEHKMDSLQHYLQVHIKHCLLLLLMVLVHSDNKYICSFIKEFNNISILLSPLYFFMWLRYPFLAAAADAAANTTALNTIAAITPPITNYQHSIQQQIMITFTTIYTIQTVTTTHL